MKKRLRRNNFNMVEIMLAVIVIALGIAGTFVLFPVGLNANKDATAENSIADIAEYVTAFVRAEVLVASRSGDDDNPTEDVSKGFNTKKSFYESGDKYKETVEVDNPDNWEIPETHKSRHKSGSSGSSESEKGVAMILSHSSEKGVFLVRQLSGPEGNRFVDFAAVARVYLDNKDADGTGLTGEYFPSANADITDMTQEATAEEIQALKKSFLPAILELSWPASVSYEDREKRYFRFEVFNDHFRL